MQVLKPLTKGKLCNISPSTPIHELGYSLIVSFYLAVPLQLVILLL